MKKGNAMFYGAMMLTGANLLLRFVSMGFQVYLSPANRRRRHRPSAIDLLSGGVLLYPGLCRGPDLRHVPVARGSRSRVRYLARRSLRVGLLFGLTAAGLLFSGAPALGGLLYGDDAVLWFP